MSQSYHDPLDPAIKPKDFVLKFARDNWESHEMRIEEETTRKVKNSAHCIQLIEPNDIGKAPNRTFIRTLAEDDSSEDCDTSGDDSATNAQLRRIDERQRNRRRDRSANILARRQRRRAARVAEITAKIAEEGEEYGNVPRKDFIIVEYMENGDFANLLMKLTECNNYSKIPNRVLWAFWLCLVRACVAMEYPPRKHHSARKRPIIPENAVPEGQAKANRMLRELKRLGIPVYNQVDYETRAQQHDQVKGDLIEDIPQGLKAVRRQNLVHFDIDPQNILVSGFELDPTGLEQWDSLRQQEAARAPPNKPLKPLSSTGKRWDRINGEHELVPKLKLADFGLAEKIKRQKRNVYYFNRRFKGKHGYYAPEQFGPEWEGIPNTRDGDELADSSIAGFYGPHTNIWGIALTMWMLITRFKPPIPPQPQIPPDTDTSNWNFDDVNSIRSNIRLMGFAQPISYCPLLRDDRVDDYNWADQTLRQTIYECMYHRPKDRPTLDVLLQQAKQKVTQEFPGETDQVVRAWIHKWFYNPPDPGAPQSPRTFPPELQHIEDHFTDLTEARRYFDAKRNSDHEIRLHWRLEFDKTFIYGFQLIQNNAAGFQCGIQALVDSLVDFLRRKNPLVAPPSAQDLETRAQAMQDRGDFDLLPPGPDPTQMENNILFKLSAVVYDWGQQHGLNLRLGYRPRDRRPMYESNLAKDPVQMVWIWSDNAIDLTQAAQNVYSGIHATDPANPDEGRFDDDGNLPDYVNS
ncbi:hypothetical protein F5B20DRAFT_538587 [Whalleya microplaca]|nr:hypothetical protein F5B20DRAFT_538587 [Whalleya microplaca]